MQTIKTGVVVALLLAVCYGAYVALNAPEPDLPASIEQWASGADDFETLAGFDLESEMMSMESAVPVSPDQLFVGTENASASNSLGAGGNDVGVPALPSMESSQAAKPEESLFDRKTNPAPLSPEPSNSGLAQALPSIPGTNSADALPAMPGLNNQGAAADSNAASSQPADSNLASFPALDAGPANLANGAAAAPREAANTEFPGMPALPTAPLDVQTIANRTNTPGNTSLIPPLLSSGESGNPGSSNGDVSAAGNTNLPTMDFATARKQALEQANTGNLKDALALLSQYYKSPEIGSAEQADLTDILDALSREVIYSRRHLLEPAFVVGQGDTVASVAGQFGINPEFLNAVNELGDAKTLVPGSQLKVVRGPFRASVDLASHELTVYLGDNYAGRFPISTGRDPSPKPGVFEVVDRQLARTYYGAGAVVLPGKDPRNPYGGYWLNLGDALCIHGTPEMASSDLDDAGCISLAPLDARDVYSILVVGSRVEIVE